jgi:hypothetical protein
MPAVVRPRSQPVGAPRSNEWRWVCRGHERLRVGYWTTRERAQTGATVHNMREHPRKGEQ